MNVWGFSPRTWFGCVWKRRDQMGLFGQNVPRHGSRADLCPIMWKFWSISPWHVHQWDIWETPKRINIAPPPLHHHCFRWSKADYPEFGHQLETLEKCCQRAIEGSGTQLKPISKPIANTHNIPCPPHTFVIRCVKPNCKDWKEKNTYQFDAKLSYITVLALKSLAVTNMELFHIRVVNPELKYTELDSLIEWDDSQ